MSIDAINIILMIISAILAYWWPFELFLFSYAVFGPLHYLTEISWLHQRNFFSLMRFDYIFLVVCALLLFGVFLFQDSHLNLIEYGTALMVWAFVSALVMVTIKHQLSRVLLFIAITLFSVAVRGNQLTFVLFAVLLPTIIHVFLFTVLFILFGALKAKSKLGLISVGIYGLCFLGLLFVTIDIRAYSVNSYIQEAYRAFEELNLEIMNLVNIHQPDRQAAIYASAAGLSLMRFIAFAYTYHYLNWFSKTKVIGWGQASKKYVGIIVFIWIGSVILYLGDYQKGLVWLYLLSLLHVLLEFPLNHRSIIGIGNETYKFVTSRWLKK